MDQVRLRPTRPDDLALVIAAEQDPDNRPHIVLWERDRHRRALDDPDMAHWILEQEGLGPAGFVMLAGLADPNQNLEFRRIVVTRKGRGLGRAAVRLVKRFAFADRGAHRLWLDVKAHNHRARRLYESEGFTIEGVLRECVRGPGGFESLVVMSMLAPEYREA